MEIERKWLLKNLDILCSSYVGDVGECKQTYLRTENGEIRLRYGRYSNSDSYYELTFKGEGQLSREEVNMSLHYEQFWALNNMFNLNDEDYITKKEFIIVLPNKKAMTINVVDPRAEDKKFFIYSEIEFDTEEEANKFEPCFEYEAEVTNDPMFKMKNYWTRRQELIEEGVFLCYNGACLFRF